MWQSIPCKEQYRMNRKRLFKTAALALVAASILSLTGCQPSKPANIKPEPAKTLTALANGDSYNDKDYQNGIVYEDLPDLNAENSYIVTGRYRQNIAGDVKMGTAKDQLKTLLGKPVDDENGVALYAFGDINIGFYGKKTVELAVVRKVIPAKFRKTQLSAIVQSLAGGKNLKTVAAKNPSVFDYVDSRPYLRGNFAHSNGGVEIYETLQTGTTQIRVFSNYKGDRKLKSKNPNVIVAFVSGNNLAQDMYEKIWMYKQTESDFKKSGKLSPDKSKTILNCFRDGSCYYLLLRQNDGKTPDRVLNNIYSMQLAWIDSKFLLNLDVTNTIQIVDTKTGKIVVQKSDSNVQDLKRITSSELIFDGTKGAFAYSYSIKNGKFILGSYKLVD